MGKKEKCECAEGAPEWLVTFGDLMSLLLTFFVLLLSFSVMDEIKYTQVAGSFKQTIGIMKGWESPDQIPNITPPRREKYNNEEEAMRGIGYNLKKELAEEGENSLVEVETTKEGLRLTLKESGGLRFESGGSGLSDKMKEILERITGELKLLPDNKIMVTGHTDGHPIKTAKFPSNWELSVSRARAVQKHLITSGLEENRTMIAGGGSTELLMEYSEDATDEEKAEADRQNRRVEIMILRKNKL